MVFAVIPCRQASTRFKNKSIAEIDGIPMARRVYRNVVGCVPVVVGFPLNDVGIRLMCERYKVPYVMTYEDHECGTDRVYEVVRRIGVSDGIVINVQGDEPLITHQHIHEVLKPFEDPEVKVTTLAYRGVGDRDCVKVHFDGTMRVYGFKRYNGDYICVGIMAFRMEALAEFASVCRSDREKSENVELYRCLDIGIPVHVAITDKPTIGVDRPDDIKRVEAVLRRGDD